MRIVVHKDGTCPDGLHVQRGAVQAGVVHLVVHRQPRQVVRPHVVWLPPVAARAPLHGCPHDHIRRPHIQLPCRIPHLNITRTCPLHEITAHSAIKAQGTDAVDLPDSAHV